MEPCNIQSVRKTLVALVAYLDEEVSRTKKCDKCKYNGKSFRGEPCYWHVDCGISEHDIEARDRAKELLCKFKLRAALASTPRNCDVGTPEEQSVRMAEFCRTQYEKVATDAPLCSGCQFNDREGLDCQFAWAQMPYEAGGSTNEQ